MDGNSSTKKPLKERISFSFTSTPQKIFIFLFIILIVIFLYVSFWGYRQNLSLETQNINLSAEVEAYKQTSIELEERVNKITNNYGSGGGIIVRVFEKLEKDGIIKLVDFFSFDRYHLVYSSDLQVNQPFIWETENAGTQIFNDFELMLEATTVEKYMSKPFDINTNALSMTGIAHVTFQFEVEGVGTVIPIDKTGDPSDVDFEVVKYQLEAIDSGLREAGANDSFELKLMFNSADSAGLYSVFGESETFSGNLSTAEITIEKSER
jgi:hypothetical protein